MIVYFVIQKFNVRRPLVKILERQFYGYKRYLAQQDKQMINWFRSTNRLDNTPLDIIRDYGKFTHKDESDHIVIYLIT
jgi:succinate dehydrogenase flavin-adding protein (antitoxin of CptAB toxin-antitoxin module)